MTDKNISAIVLAAGMSTRYGVENKLLAVVEGRPMIETVVDRINESGVSRIMVVTGFEAEKIVQVLKGKPQLSFVYNPDFHEGMSTSIRCAANLFSSEDFVMICLGDMPFLLIEDYRAILSEIQRRGREWNIFVPVAGGKWGHPVSFGKNYFENLINLSTGDSGAISILKKNQQNVVEIPVNHDRIFRDIDIS